MPYRILTALLLAGAAGSTLASQADWGALGPAGAEVDATPPAGPVDDVYAFSVAGSYSVTVSASNVVATGDSGERLTDLSGATITLYSGVYGDGVVDEAIDALRFDAAPVERVYIGIADGNYYFEVTGTAAGTEGAEYRLLALADYEETPFPVPEPSGALLLLAGLGALPLLRRRTR